MDDLKQRLMVGVVGFNLAVIGWMVYAQFSQGRLGAFNEIWGRLFVGVAIGVVVGGIAFGATFLMKK